MITPVSIIIAVKDNPSHIFETLNSIDDFATEIIIIDLGINPSLKQQLETNDILQILPILKEVPYIELIRNDLKQYAKYDHILFLDPDEVISPHLKQILIKNVDKYDYISIPRKNIIFGKWIQHSRWWPDFQVRLFRKTKATWPKRIHAQPELKGHGLKLQENEETAIIHYNYDSIDEFVQKAFRYAKSEAHERIVNKKKFSLTDAFKISTSEFISRFIAEGGYKDGMHGFVLASMQMFYYFLVYFYYWEEMKYFFIEPNELLQGTRKYYQRNLYELNFWLIKKRLVKSASYIKMRLLNVILRLFK